MDRQSISASELARLKLGRKTRNLSAFQEAIVHWRPSRSLRERLKDAETAVLGDWSRLKRALPELLEGEFLFALCLWVAVFVVAAAVLSTASISLERRYAVGLTALAYLYLYAELTRARRHLLGRTVVLAVADAAVAVIIYLFSVAYVDYGQLLLFFAAARMVARFRDMRALPTGILILIPFVWHRTGPAIDLVLEGFGVILLMLGIQHFLELIARARQDAGRQAALASVSSAVARASDPNSLIGHLVSVAPALWPDAAWGFWLRDDASGDFRAERWYGLPSGERPVAAFTPSLSPDRGEATAIVGPMPGTSYGSWTLLQPMVVEGETLGLITVSGGSAITAPPMRRLLGPIADESALALSRLQALGDERRRMEMMETANRLAGIAATHARDEAHALGALLPALADTLRCDSVHLEWLDGDSLEVVVSPTDVLFVNAPTRQPLARTRSSEALLGHALREPVTGRRPEDMMLATSGLRHVAVAPLTSGGRRGTLQIARREPRPFTPSEVALLQMVADRLAVVFQSNQTNPATPRSGGHG